MRHYCPSCHRRFASEQASCPDDGSRLRIDPFIGASVGRWSIVDHLGEGAMGVVYRAEPAAAIKILNARRAALQPDLVRRFEIEAEAIRRLSNPHIAQILGSGTTEEGHLYIAMELLHGDPLDRVLERTPRLITRDVISIVDQAAHALADVHANQIVHRDLKPANLFVEFGPGGNHIRLLDFGIARINTGSVARSRTGTLAGSPAYMSPEQLRGQVDIDGRSDIYSLGVLAYTMLAGFNPFRCEAGVLATVRRHLEFSPPRLPPDVPRAVARLVDDMLVKDRQRRVQSMLDVRARIEALSTVRACPPPAIDEDATLVIGEETAVDGPIVRLDRELLRLIEGEAVAPARAPPEPPPRTRQWALRQRRVLYGIAASALVAAVALMVAWRAFNSGDRAVYVDSPGRVQIAIGPSTTDTVRVDPQRAAQTAGEDKPPSPWAGVRVREEDKARRPARRPPIPTPEALLGRGNRHMAEREYAEALKTYERWLDRVAEREPPHPQFEVIRNRVRHLRATD